MTSDKSVALEQRLNSLLGHGWVTLGSPSNGWTVGGHAQYRISVDSCLIVAIKDLQPGTSADGTVVWSASHGLSGAAIPNSQRRLVAYCDKLSETTIGGIDFANGAALEFETDGSVQCYGISINAARVDLYGIFPIDD